MTKIYRLADSARQIVIYPDRKIRCNYFGRPSSPDRRTTAGDEWPVLWRRDVSTLTDDEWYASPGPEWTEVLA